MKLGLLSDIHGDAEALEKAWAHLTKLGADAVVCAGDLVGYGPSPDRAVAFLAEKDVPCVRGNHDRWALERGPGAADEFGGGTPSAETLDFLAQLPFDRVFLFEGCSVVVVHGSPRSDMEFVGPETHPPRILDSWLRDLNADVLVMGHTHRPLWYPGSSGLVVNPGSVISAGRVETSRTFALVELPARTVTFHDADTADRVVIAPMG